MGDSDQMKVKNNNFIRNTAEHVTIDFKMDDGCALSIIGGSLMTLIAVIFIGVVDRKSFLGLWWMSFKLVFTFKSINIILSLWFSIE